MRERRRLLPLLAAITVFAGANALSGEAEAQYKNYTFGFEGGYVLYSEGTGLKPHNWGLGIFGGWKSSDHWWFSARALLSFPGQLDNAPNTVIHLQLVPISLQYYFETDRFRPFVGLTNAFQISVNSTDSVSSILWGPGVQAGMEFKLKRDLFLGFRVDGFWMLKFDGPSAQVLTATTQLIFFM